MQERGDPSVLTYGAIQLIPAAHTVLLSGKPVHLAKMEYRLLGYLLQHPGETLPRQDLPRRILSVQARRARSANNYTISD